MINRKYFAVLSVFLIIVVFWVITYYKGQTIKLQPSFETSSMQDLYLKHREGNEVKWELSAGQAVFPMGKEEIFLTSIGLKINRSPEMYLTSGNGIYHINSGNVDLSNSVRMNVRDTVFTTSTMKWNSREDLITSSEDVRFSGEKFVVEGTGISAEIKNQKVRILKNVKATFDLSERGDHAARPFRAS